MNTSGDNGDAAEDSGQEPPEVPAVPDRAGIAIVSFCGGVTGAILFAAGLVILFRQFGYHPEVSDAVRKSGEAVASLALYGAAFAALTGLLSGCGDLVHGSRKRPLSVFGVAASASVLTGLAGLLFAGEFIKGSY